MPAPPNSRPSSTPQRASGTTKSATSAKSSTSSAGKQRTLKSFFTPLKDKLATAASAGASAGGQHAASASARRADDGVQLEMKSPAKRLPLGESSMLNCQEVAQSAAVEKMQKETAAVDINAASDAHVFATSTMQLDGNVDENNDMPVQPLPVAPSSPAVVTGNAKRSCALDEDEVIGSGEDIAADNHVDDDESGGFRVDSTTAISDGPSKKRRVQKPSGEVTVEVVIYKPTLADSTTPAENATPATPVQCESGLALTSAMTTPAAVSASPSPSPSFAVPRPPADLVQIKNGRVVLHEKKLPLDKDLETLKELCEFQQYHAQITDATLVALPDQFHGLLAKLVHESDATVSLLAKQILGQLCPQGLVAEAAAKAILPAKAIVDAIHAVATRVNYGWGGNTPANANVAIWRWECNDLKWFTPAVQAVLVQRRERRERARTALESYFQALPDEARAVVLSTKKRKKEGVDSTMGSASSAITIVGGTGCTSETTTPSKPGTDAQARRELERQRKEQEKQAEKDRKEKEKQAEKDRKEQEKQAEKERKEQERQGERDRKEQERLAERDRKELERLAEKERKDKEKSEKIEAKLAALAEKEAARVAKEEQRRLALEQKEQERLKAEQAQKRISGFFTAVKKDTDSDTASRAEVSDFDKAFPGFHVKLNVTLAPIHAISVRRNDNFAQDIEPQQLDTEPTSAYLSFVRNVKKMTGIKRGHLHSDVAYQVQYRTVKLLQFHENYRPAFFGTWARKTMSVRGRNPFGKDSVVLDYENDSEEEWEEEEEGDECLSDEEDEDDDEPMEDAQADGDEEDQWLVPHGYLSDDEGLNEDDESNTSAPPSPSRRKMSATTAATSTADGKGPRKKLEPLQHIIRGPKFVDDMETMVDAEFFTMRVRMLLSSSFPLDPFALPVSAIESFVAANSSRPVSAHASPAADKRSCMPAPAATARPKKITEFPAAYLEQLAEIMAGKSTGVDKVVEEFRAKIADEAVSKYFLVNKIKAVAVKEKSAAGKLVWRVHESVYEEIKKGKTGESTPVSDTTDASMIVAQPHETMESSAMAVVVPVSAVISDVGISVASSPLESVVAAEALPLPANDDVKQPPSPLHGTL